VREGAESPPRRERLSAHDTTSLTAWLVARGLSPTAGRSAALRVIRRVLAEEGELDEGALLALQIGKRAREALLSLEFRPALVVDQEAESADGTLRLVLRAEDGALVEAVLIPGPARTTLCISSQVGCARACTFCETGRLGLSRQLSAAEIVDQVRVAREVYRRRSAEAPRPPLVNIVFMGMGEPFDNLDPVLQAIRALSDSTGLGFGASRITVSTVGVVDKLAAFFSGCRAELAVSLNAPDDTRRSAIMPINRRVPLARLREALVATLPRGRRVLFEYVLFDRWNDAPEDADALVSFTEGIRCRVNVIPANPGPDPALRPPEPARLAAFVARVAASGRTTLVRAPKGRDVGGACGQLAGARRLPVVP
jgi:23S rRNA (adenine2503-C2)-methyltransferase